MDGFYPGRDPAAARAWRIVDALRRYGTDSTAVSHAYATRQGLGTSDLQALVAIMAAEGGGHPLTPGALRAHVGLSSGGTSYVIDRLETAGHIRRVHDHLDSRVVHLRYTEQGMATAMAFFGELGRRTERVIATLSPDEQEVVGRFLDAAATQMHELLTALRQPERPQQ